MHQPHRERPSERWRYVRGTDAMEPPEVGHWTAANEHQDDDRGFGVAFHAATQCVRSLVTEEDTRTQILHAIGAIEDAHNGHAVTASVNGYDAGFGDGWTVGVIVAMRLACASVGIDVPKPSGTLALLLGLPGDHVYEGPPEYHGEPLVADDGASPGP